MHLVLVPPYAYSLDQLIYLGSLGKGYIALLDSTVVGFLLYDTIPHVRSHLPTVTIIGIGVNPSNQRQQIGTQLMSQFHAKFARVNTALHVRVSNFNALQLYVKLGYVKTTDLPGFYVNPEEDGYYLERKVIILPSALKINW
jgi:ribosomal protein S18 acetylase RimI-like enzyme